MTDYITHSRRTPMNSSYPSCDSTYVELLVYIDGNAALVTEQLGIEPSYMQNKGDTLTNSRGLVREANCSYWSLSSEGKVASKDVRHHLNWLLHQLSNKELPLRQLQRQPNINMAVNCIWHANGTGGPTLWPEQMNDLARFNLELTFDLY